MLQLLGAPALSEFRIKKLLADNGNFNYLQKELKELVMKYG